MKGQIAAITGGASGIGRATALLLAERGVNLALLDRDLELAKRAAEQARSVGVKAVALEVDVASLTQMESAAGEVRAALGSPAILVHSAGIAGFEPFLEMTEASFDRMIAVHLKGAFNGAKVFAPAMVEAGYGRIVFVSSVAGLNGGGAGLAHYAAAKAGILGLTKALGAEFGPRGVTVNAIAPGLIDTPLIHPAGAPAGLYDKVVQAVPAKRIGQPEDVAAVCGFLVSPQASFTIGQVLSPNGGGYM